MENKADESMITQTLALSKKFSLDFEAAQTEDEKECNS